ncbi:hypothetical protein GE21DRAFT_1066972 [Neurospora crassa]|nr:hypothetical protein GE21DRAFT_1066972 [Neurospora crassa]
MAILMSVSPTQAQARWWASLSASLNWPTKSTRRGFWYLLWCWTQDFFSPNASGLPTSPSRSSSRQILDHAKRVEYIKSCNLCQGLYLWDIGMVGTRSMRGADGMSGVLGTEQFQRCFFFLFFLFLFVVVLLSVVVGSTSTT